MSEYIFVNRGDSAANTSSVIRRIAPQRMVLAGRAARATDN